MTKSPKRPASPPAEEISYDGSTGDPTVVAYDPGGVTGWCVVSVHPDALIEPEIMLVPNILHFEAGQFIGSEREMVRQMLELNEVWTGAATVMEDFIWRAGGNMSREVLSPVRISAAFRYALTEERSMFLQQPSLAKTTMTDDRLRAAGYLERTTARPHARDASRHALTFLLRLKNNPGLLARAFPALVR